METQMQNFEKHCWAEVDLDALRHNFALIQKQVGQTPVCAVVKACAYGHGDEMVAHTLAEQGAAWFAVSCLAEALRLRRQGIRQPILILGYTAPPCAAQLAQNEITQAIFSPEYATALSKAAQQAGVRVAGHLKVDTGMGRIGFSVREGLEPALTEMETALALPGLEITGLFQHFAVADSTQEENCAYTERQHSLFLQVRDALLQRGYALRTVHCCNSAGLVRHPEWGADLVRAGIILYGEAPSDEVGWDELRPVLQLKTVVSQVKTLAPGESVSYGRLFTAQKPMRVATLCAGYADGYPRLLSGKGIAALHGRPAPVLGRVCMDQMLVDVTDIPEVQAGDEAALFGGQGPQDSLLAAAEKTGTITYELLCGITARVPRVYIENGVAVAQRTLLA